MTDGSTPMARVRPERAGDAASVRSVVAGAFGRNAEADLVDALRRCASPVVLLVAECGHAVVGHICFSPVTMAGCEVRMMGLGPVAVAPAFQRQGIGAALVRAGLDACRASNCDAVVVLGHAGYYPRFGFQPASHFGIRSEYDVPDEAFMAIELKRGALANQSGIASYHPAFAAV